MGTGYNVISADSHVFEPDLWVDRIEPRFRDRAPRFVHQGGEELFVVEGLPTRNLMSLGMAGRPYDEDPRKAQRQDVRSGGWDPVQRLKDMALDGVDAEVLYPSVCLFMWQVPDVPYQNACLRAYNDWLAEYCSAAPERLAGIGLLNLEDIEAGVAELQRVAKIGLRGVAISVFPRTHQDFGDPFYDPFWFTAQDLGIPVSLHTSTAGSADRPTRYWLPRFIAERQYQIQLALGVLIESGVLERYPGLKVVSAENHIGWVGTFVKLIDQVYVRRRYGTELLGKLKLFPSEYFHRQVLCTFIEDPEGIAIRHRIGVDNIMWSSDYPHTDSTWPHSQKAIAEHFVGVPEGERRKMVCDNAARLYRFA